MTTPAAADAQADLHVQARKWFNSHMGDVVRKTGTGEDWQKIEGKIVIDANGVTCVAIPSVGLVEVPQRGYDTQNLRVVAVASFTPALLAETKLQ